MHFFLTIGKFLIKLLSIIDFNVGNKAVNKLAYLGGDPVRTSPWPSWPKAGKKEYLYVKKVLESNRWFAGPLGNDENSFCSIFSEKFSNLQGIKYSQTVSNGSVAIEIALKALGVEPGDKVIVPSYTFISTATSVLRVGGIPIFADIDLDNYCISPSDVENKIDEKTVGIIPVHLGGHLAEMQEIMKLAEKHNLFVIEDCAQAIGASFKGKKAGSWGNVGTFSFQSNKTITSGEGGLVATNSKE